MTQQFAATVDLIRVSLQLKAKLWKSPWATCAKPLSYIWRSLRLILKSVDETLDNIYSNSQERIDDTQLLYF